MKVHRIEEMRWKWQRIGREFDQRKMRNSIVDIVAQNSLIGLWEADEGTAWIKEEKYCVVTQFCQYEGYKEGNVAASIWTKRQLLC